MINKFAKSNDKVLDNKILSFFLIFPHFKLTGLDFGYFIDILKIISILAVILLYFVLHIHINKFVVLSISFTLPIIISTFINNGDVVSALYYPLGLLGFFLTVNMYLEQNNLTVIKTLRNYLALLIIINLFFQIFYQDFFGYTPSYNYVNFFQSDNYLGYYYVAYICLLIFHDKACGKEKSLFTKTMILICTYSIFLAWAGKAVVGIAVVLAYLIFLYEKKIANIISYKLMLAAYLASFFGLIIFRLQYLLEFLIVGILGKSLTISARTYLWDSSMYHISLKPIIGYGTERGGELSINQLSMVNATASHNMILEILLQGGVIALIPFIAFNIYLVYIGKKNSKNQVQAYFTLFAAFCWLVQMIMYLMSHTFYIAFAYMPLILCYHGYKFINDDENVQLKQPSKHAKKWRLF